MNKIKKFFKRGGSSDGGFMPGGGSGGYTSGGVDDGGFTLVELLIVIGLLGAIALIVIAAINPIEQANRARDTRFKADSAQLISAIDRYFAARSEFTWVTSGSAANNDAFYGFISAGDEGIGVCGATCAATGSLIANDELKSAFANRDFIKEHTGTDDSKKIFMGKATGTSESIYACFIPLSQSERTKWDTELKDITQGGLIPAGGLPTDCGTEPDWTNTFCYRCLPN